MKKFVLILLATFLVFNFAACGKEEETIDNPNPVEPLKDSDEIVMEYEGASIDTGLYGFIFSYLKGIYLHYYQSESYSSVVEDTLSFWNTPIEGTTIGKLAVSQINDHCKMLLISDKLVKKYDVSLDNGEHENVEAQLNDLISAYGSVEDFGDYLKRYGITVDEVEKWLEDRALISALQAELCGKGGLCEITEKEIKDKFNSSYGKATHIFLSNDKNKGDAKSKADEILAELNAGAKLDDYAKLSDDTTFSVYPNGTLFRLNDENAYAKVVSGMSGDSHALCEADYGVYIIKAFELTDEDLEGAYNDVFSELSNEKFTALICESYGLVELNAEELEKYDIVTAEVVGF